MAHSGPFPSSGFPSHGVSPGQLVRFNSAPSSVLSSMSAGLIGAESFINHDGENGRYCNPSDALQGQGGFTTMDRPMTKPDASVDTDPDRNRTSRPLVSPHSRFKPVPNNGRIGMDMMHTDQHTIDNPNSNPNQNYNSWFSVPAAAHPASDGMTGPGIPGPGFSHTNYPAANGGNFVSSSQLLRSVSNGKEDLHDNGHRVLHQNGKEDLHDNGHRILHQNGNDVLCGVPPGSDVLRGGPAGSRGCLFRHSSSPAGFLSQAMNEECEQDRLMVASSSGNSSEDGGTYEPRGGGTYFSGRYAYEEAGNVMSGSPNATLPAKKRTIRDVDNDKYYTGPVVIDSQRGDALQHGGLINHFSLARSTSPENTYLADKLSSDSVPCRARAKRGCATHPRSIAERVRRTKISERMKKLQELVPNMEKQTNTAEMLDEAVEYVKTLQRQVQDLTEARSKCTCSSKK